MKRIIVAAVLIVLSITIGIITKVNLHANSVLFTERMEKIKRDIENGKTEQAKTECKKLSDDFANKSTKLMHLYYSHNMLNSIEKNMVLMEEYLRIGEPDDFRSCETATVKMLKDIDKKEELTLQNIL